jgi:hypothetical protein
MKSSRRLLLLLSILILGLVVLPAAAESQLLQPAQAKITDLDSSIPVWERNANTTKRLTLTVAILAVIVTLLQPLGAGKELPTRGGPKSVKPRWVPVATGIIGAVVAITTAVLDKGFSADHRGYRKAVVSANDLKSRLQTQIAIFNESPDLIDSPGDAAEAKAQRHARRLEFLNKNIEPLLREISSLTISLAANRPVAPFGVLNAAELRMSGSIATESTGACNTLWQSQELSYNAAVEKMAFRLRAWSRQPNAALEPLRDYVKKYADRSQSRAEPDKRSGMQQFKTTLNLSPLFLNWNAAGPFFRPQPAMGSPTGPVLARGTATGSASAGSRQAVIVPVLAPNSRDGHFQFSFLIDRPAGAAPRLLLQSMEIYEDGSPLTTAWRFVITVDGQPVMEVPTQRFDDSARPTRCRLDADAGLTVPLPPSSGVYRIDVAGYRP